MTLYWVLYGISVICSANVYSGLCKKYLVSIEMMMCTGAYRKYLLSVVTVFILGPVRNICSDLVYTYTGSCKNYLLSEMTVFILRPVRNMCFLL